MPIKKKISKLPAKQDFTQLNEEVSKLIGQTGLLKDEPTDSPEKPHLPKRRRIPTKTGAAMDIVHPTVKITRRARLKSVASESDESSPNSDSTIEGEEKRVESKASAVKKTVPAVDLKVKVAKPLELTPEVALQPEPKGDAADLPSPGDAEAEDAREEPAEVSDAEHLQTESGELYANNLVQHSEPKGYIPHANQKGMAVFDVEEYHLELHDWSSLNKNPRITRLLLLLMLVVIGAALYYFGIFNPIFS